MTRSVALLVFTLVALIAGESAVQAQFQAYGNNFYYRPAFQTPHRFYSYQYFSLSGVSNTGVPYNFYNYRSNVSPFPINPFAQNYNFAPSYSPSNSMSGGYGSYSEGQFPDLTRQRNALKNAQEQAKWETPSTAATRNDFDDWLREQSSRRSASNPENPALDGALINPNDEQLLSGLTLNELAERILALEAKNKKASPGLCPSELVGKIAFAGGPAADALNRFHAAKLDYPEIMKMPDFNMLVEAFDKAYTPIAAALQAGKNVPVADILRTQTLLERARPITEPMLKPATLKDASALLAFYSSLDAGLKYLKQPESLGIIGSKWSTIGVNVSDLVKHLHKYNIRFGRAAAGDDAAYGSLHRGLLAYYAALSQAK